ncbi:MAG: protein tyrosine phosphatase [Planctomycetota bacterium]|nr:MAG: protein tyrosine phosphatase [Planctomycetota bacterium]
MNYLTVLLLFAIAALSGCTCSGGAMVKIPKEELDKVRSSVLTARKGLVDTIAYMNKRTDLFPAKDQERETPLTRQQRLEIWGIWQQFLDYILSLDASMSSLNPAYKKSEGKRRKDLFRIGFAAFLAQYRYAMDFIFITERDDDFHVILNEPVTELGMKEGTYKQLKFRFLNVIRGARFARLAAVYSFFGKGKDEDLKKAIADDKGAIWKAGRLEGPIKTLQNGGQIAKDASFAAWFPVQKGVGTWMGDTKVWRLKKSLITKEQISEIKKKLEPGDIILVRHEWYLSNIGLPGFWPHAALYVGTPEQREKYFDEQAVNEWLSRQGTASGSIEDYLKKSYPKAYGISSGKDKAGHEHRIIEALSEGVSFTSLEHCLDADCMVILRPNLPKVSKAHAIVQAFHFSGRPYDFNFDFLTDSTMVCTELVYKSYTGTDEIKGLKIPLVEILGRKTLPANEIVKLFDKEYGTDKQQFEFIYFLDGNEDSGKAFERDVKTLRESFKRSKWHIWFQDDRKEK